MNGVILFLVLLILSLVGATFVVKKGANPKKAIITQIVSFIIIFGASVLIQSETLAASSTNTTSQSQASESTSAAQGMGYLGMALAIGLGSIGSGLAVAAAAPAAIGATSEDPKAFGKAIVFVGMAEGVAVFGLLISIFINGHLA